MIDLDKIKQDYIKSLSKGWDEQTKEDFDLFLENEAESFIEGFKEGWNMAIDQCAKTAESGFFGGSKSVDKSTIYKNKIV